ncbi:MAG: NigD-like protein [Prolixibacteraceae bacterium]|nr:NigD-like protein [Prolixibacteraceae bacterium]
MKRIIFFLMAIALIVFYSCNDDEEHYSLGDVWLSMGFINVPDTSAHSFFVVTDNKDTLLPLANNVPYYETKDQQRVIVNYTILDDADTLGNKYWVKINNLQDVLYKKAIAFSANITDSLGNDPIQVKDVWLTNQILNFDLGFYGGSKTHLVNLTYNPDDIIAKKTPMELELRHNAQNDSLPYYLRAIVSFDLGELIPKGSDSINFEVKYLNLKNEKKTLPGTVGN